MLWPNAVDGILDVELRNRVTGHAHGNMQVAVGDVAEEHHRRHARGSHHNQLERACEVAEGEQ